MLADQQRGKPLAHRDRFIDRARRPMAQHLNSVHDAPEFGHDLTDPLRTRGSRFGECREQTAGGRQVPQFELTQVVVDTRLVARLGVPGGIEQKVGDLRHRGDHRHYGPPGRFRGNQIACHLHPFGGPHAGPAELHHQKMYPEAHCSFPLEMRARTSFRISSSTSSGVMPVESR